MTVCNVITPQGKSARSGEGLNTMGTFAALAIRIASSTAGIGTSSGTSNARARRM